jgi:hypothetical protein
MTSAKTVLVIGLEPTLLDFGAPEFQSMPGLSADKIRAGLEADQARLVALGCEAEVCLTDLGDTAASVVAARLREKSFACVVIGAGVRAIPRYFLLFGIRFTEACSSGPV